MKKITDTLISIVNFTAPDFVPQIVEMLPRDAVVFDVGCYIGMFSSRVGGELVRKHGGPETRCRFFMFDGNADLREKVYDNMGALNFELINVAVTDRNGAVDYWVNDLIPPAGTGVRAIAKDANWSNVRFKLLSTLKLNKNLNKDQMFRKTSVEAVTLDTFCEDRGIDRIDLLKIDVEGDEHNVLAGCGRLFSEGRISVLQCEILDRKTEIEAKFERIRSQMQGYGMDLIDRKKIVSTGVLSDLTAMETLFALRS